MAIAAIRYNNPGNVSLPIKGWKGGGTIVGIKGQVGYAHFPDMQTGYAAMQHRIKDYIQSKGLTSIAELNSRYAEDQNWKFGVSKFSGIGVNTKLDPNNPAQIDALASGIIRQETGKSAAELGIKTGVTDKVGASSAVSAENADYPWQAKDVGTPGLAPVKISEDMVAATDTQTVQQAQSAAQQADAIIAAAAQTAATHATTTQAALQSTGSWIEQIQAWMGDYIVRTFIVLLGLLLIFGALAMLVWKGDPAKALGSVTPVAAAT